jgi:hypothetical protein
VMAQILHQLSFGLGKTDDAEDTHQDRQYDHYGPARQIFSHEELCLA